MASSLQSRAIFPNRQPPTNTRKPTTFYARFGKRLFDCAVALILLLALLPVLVGVAILVRIKLGAPILFTQERPGLGGQIFWIRKFRTMREDRDADGAVQPDAMRLTRFGQFVRATSLDELPELWNVLMGEMSLVGPRPLLPQYLSRYSAEQAHRHDVKPGITGWAQVNGRNAISWEEKFLLDVWYVENLSFQLDLRILWLTIWKTIRREGISAEGEATTVEFKGNEE